jgi:rhamnulokinase
MKHCVISVDLGASGTKVFLSELENEQINIRELDRFESFAYVQGSLSYWDIDRLFHRIMDTVKKASEAYPITSIGFDGWGVDFVALDENDQKLSDPIQYFSMFTASQEIKQEIEDNLDFITQTIPTQYQSFNTVYQLMYLKKQNPDFFSRIKKIVSIPSYLAGKLTGHYVYEFTHASTTQIYDYLNNSWSEEIIRRLGFGNIFPEVVTAGTVIGEYDKIRVILPASHDTASAYASITSDPASTLNISLGTWCLNGIILKDKVIHPEAISKHNYAVEGCYNGDLRILANTPGLILWQKAKADLENEYSREIDYQELEKMARSQGDFSLSMNVDDPQYFMTEHLLESIYHEIQEKNSSMALTFILNGIAERIKKTKVDMESIYNRKIKRVHIIGGGVKNRFLCQKIAEKVNLPVKTNPQEGTAVGNTMIQLLGSGLIGSEQEMKKLIDHSTKYLIY